MEAHKDAADELKKWRRIVKAARWRKFEEVRSISGTIGIGEARIKGMGRGILLDKGRQRGATSYLVSWSVHSLEGFSLLL